MGRPTDLKRIPSMRESKRGSNLVVAASKQRDLSPEQDLDELALKLRKHNAMNAKPRNIRECTLEVVLQESIFSNPELVFVDQEESLKLFGLCQSFSDCFFGLSISELSDLADSVPVLRLRKSHVLFAPNDPVSFAVLVLSGSGTLQHGKEERVFQLGDLVGCRDFFSGGLRTHRARATSDELVVAAFPRTHSLIKEEKPDLWFKLLRIFGIAAVKDAETSVLPETSDENLDHLRILSIAKEELQGKVLEVHHTTFNQGGLGEGLTPEELSLIFGKMHYLKLQKNDELFKKGDVALNVYFLLSGTVTESVHGDTHKRTREKGNYVGCEEFMLNEEILRKREHSAWVDAPGDAVVLPFAEVLILSKKYPPLACKLFSRMAALVAKDLLLYHKRSYIPTRAHNSVLLSSYPRLPPTAETRLPEKRDAARLWRSTKRTFDALNVTAGTDTAKMLSKTWQNEKNSVLQRTDATVQGEGEDILRLHVQQASRTEVAGVLKACQCLSHFWRKFSDHDMEELAEIAIMARVAEGCTIMQQGHAAECFGLLVTGTAGIKLAEHPDEFLDDLGAGDLFGHVPLFVPGPRSYSLEATSTNCLLVLFKYNSLGVHVQKNSVLALKILQTLTQALCHAVHPKQPIQQNLIKSGVRDKFELLQAACGRMHWLRRIAGDTALFLLSQKMRVSMFQAKSVILQTGTLSSGLGIVLEGICHVVCAGKSKYHIPRNAGELIGEHDFLMAKLGEVSPVHNDVYTRTSTVIGFFTHDDLHELHFKYPAFVQRVMAHIVIGFLDRYEARTGSIAIKKYSKRCLKTIEKRFKIKMKQVNKMQDEELMEMEMKPLAAVNPMTLLQRLFLHPDDEVSKEQYLEVLTELGNVQGNMMKPDVLERLKECRVVSPAWKEIPEKELRHIAEHMTVVKPGHFLLREQKNICWIFLLKGELHRRERGVIVEKLQIGSFVGKMGLLCALPEVGQLECTSEDVMLGVLHPTVFITRPEVDGTYKGRALKDMQLYFKFVHALVLETMEQMRAIIPKLIETESASMHEQGKVQQHASLETESCSKDSKEIVRRLLEAQAKSPPWLGPELSEDDLQDLAEIMLMQHFKPHEQVFKRKSIPSSLLLVLDGELSVRIDGLNSPELTELHPGDFFGAEAYLKGDSMRAWCMEDVYASKSSTILVLPFNKLEQLGERLPLLLKVVIWHLADVSLRKTMQGEEHALLRKGMGNHERLNKLKLAGEAEVKTAKLRLHYLQRCQSASRFMVGFSAEDLGTLSSFMTVLCADPGQSFIYEGDIPSYFGMVLDGKVEVQIGDKSKKSVVHLAQGEMVGELSMLLGSSRGASVIALTERTKLCIFTLHTMDALFLNAPHLGARLLRVFASAAMTKREESLLAAKVPETFQECSALFQTKMFSMLKEALLKNSNWVDGMLTNSDVYAMSTHLHLARAAPGEHVLHRGRLACGLLLVLSGELEVTQYGLHSKVVGSRGTGDFIGEMGFLSRRTTDCTRGADVYAKEESFFAVLYYEDMSKLAARFPLTACRLYAGLGQRCAWTMLEDAFQEFPESKLISLLSSQPTTSHTCTLQATLLKNPQEQTPLEMTPLAEEQEGAVKWTGMGVSSIVVAAYLKFSRGRMQRQRPAIRHQNSILQSTILSQSEPQQHAAAKLQNPTEQAHPKPERGRPGTALEHRMMQSMLKANRRASMLVQSSSVPPVMHNFESGTLQTQSSPASEPPKLGIVSGGRGDQGQMMGKLMPEHEAPNRRMLLKDAGKRSISKPSPDTPVLSLEQARKIQVSRNFTNPMTLSLMQQDAVGGRQAPEGKTGVLMKTQFRNLAQHPVTHMSGKSEVPLSAWNSPEVTFDSHAGRPLLREASEKSRLRFNSPEGVLPARESSDEGQLGLSTHESVLPVRESAKQIDFGMKVTHRVLPAMDVMSGPLTVSQILGNPKISSPSTPDEQARSSQYADHSCNTPKRMGNINRIGISGLQSVLSKPQSPQPLFPEHIAQTPEGYSHALLGGSSGKEEFQERMLADASDPEFDSQDDDSDDDDEYQFDEELLMMKHAERTLMKLELRPVNTSASASVSSSAARWKAFRSQHLGQHLSGTRPGTPEAVDSPESEDLQKIDSFQQMHTPPPIARTKVVQLELNVSRNLLHSPPSYARSMSPQLDLDSSAKTKWNHNSNLTPLLRSDEYPWDKIVSFHGNQDPRRDKSLGHGLAQPWDNNQSELRFKYRERLDALIAFEGPLNDCRHRVPMPSGTVQYGLIPKKCLSPDPQLCKQKNSSRH